MDENTITQRLKSLQRIKTTSVKAFADAIAKPQTTVNNYFKYKREPSLDVICSILLTYPDVSPDWLLLGKGSMFRDLNNSAHGIILENTNIYQKGRNNVNASSGVTIQDTLKDNKDAIIQRLLDQNQQLLDMIKQK